MRVTIFVTRIFLAKKLL